VYKQSLACLLLLAGLAWGWCVIAVHEPIQLAVQPSPEEGHDLALLQAIIEVESNGNPHAKGRAGELGILQIRPILVKDVNRIEGIERYSLEDRTDPLASIQMFWIYSDHYSSGESREVIARRWNGGPRGDQKASTARYWALVKARLSEMSEQSRKEKAR